MCVDMYSYHTDSAKMNAVGILLLRLVVTVWFVDDTNMSNCVPSTSWCRAFFISSVLAVLEGLYHSIMMEKVITCVSQVSAIRKYALSSTFD